MTRRVDNLDGPVTRILIGIIRVYQGTLSGWLGRQCRFVPTCSQYFIEALRLHGPVRGSRMGILRILRCHPFARGGFDPVEPPGNRK